MAYYRKLASGKWRAEIEVSGERSAKGGFPIKRDAQEWASQIEADMRGGRIGKWPVKTVADAVDRYLREETPKKGSKANEEARLGAFRRDFPALMAKRLVDVNPDDLQGWIKARLTSVKPSTVNREANTLSHIWTVAARVWRWCPLESPWSFVDVPSDGPPRDRRIPWQEVRVICRRLGYISGRKPTSMQGEVAYCWLIALRTAMRSGEILNLQRSDVDLGTRVVRLAKHKTLRYTGRPRFVPVTRQAARLICVLVDAAKSRRREDLFSVSDASRDALFRKCVGQLNIEGLRFHDSRGEALTLLSKKVDVMTLQKISGHVNVNTLVDHYYRETPAEIAARL